MRESTILMVFLVWSCCSEAMFLETKCRAVSEQDKNTLNKCIDNTLLEMMQYDQQYIFGKPMTEVIDEAQTFVDKHMPQDIPAVFNWAEKKAVVVFGSVMFFYNQSFTPRLILQSPLGGEDICALDLLASKGAEPRVYMGFSNGFVCLKYLNAKLFDKATFIDRLPGQVCALKRFVEVPVLGAGYITADCHYKAAISLLCSAQQGWSSFIPVPLEENIRSLDVQQKLAGDWCIKVTTHQGQTYYFDIVYDSKGYSLKPIS